ncbi:hypothetical protein CHUAL_001462 [Chamberlinius hualienensis]
MLEGLAAWVLNNYLGRYVENLNTDQLSIGLLKGEVELECLPLRKDAFNFQDIPIRVVAGYVGKIRLKIPVTRLRSEPWVISIEQLYILVGPTPKSEYDEESEQEREINAKLAKLDEMEATWRNDYEAKEEASYYSSSYSSWFSYGASFVSNVIENVQLIVKNVHIRFEDSSTVADKPVACGITIDSLIAQSANENWLAQFVQKGEGEITRKLVELQNFSVYWDVNNVKLVGNLDFQDLLDSMHELLSCKMDSERSSHDYVLEPVCAKARIERNCNFNPLKSRRTPRITCDIFLDKFLISLNEIQYGNAVSWCYEFNRFMIAQPYLKWRPLNPVIGNAGEWWKFSARYTMEKVSRRKQTRNWDFVLKRAKDNVLYVEAYTQHLINPVTCPNELREHKYRMEQEVDFKELKILRELAMVRVISIKEAMKTKDAETKSRNGAGLLQRWFPLWTGWYSASDTESHPELTPDETMFELDTSQVIEDELLDVLNDSVEETDSLFRRDFVFARINFTLKSGVFAITSTVSDSSTVTEPLLNLELSSVSLGVELRPRAASTLFDLTLGALYVKDAMTTGSIFPFIAAPQGHRDAGSKQQQQGAFSSTFRKVFPWMTSTAPEETAEQPLFHLSYEKRPLRSMADYKLHVRSSSLDVVYNAAVFNRLREFIVTPHSLAANSGSSQTRLGEELAAVANKVKQQTKEELLKKWDKMLRGQEEKSLLTRRWDIQLDISTPQVIVPENFLDQDTTIVIFNFGRLQFCTDCPQRMTSPTSPSLSVYYEEEANDEEDEVFRTPFSTPPAELEQEIEDTAVPSSPGPPQPQPPTHTSITELSESALQRRMYERFSLQLKDLQILVTKARTNWKYTYLQGTSSTHVVNRFSINCYLERRIVHTVEAKWPRAKVCGDLASLVIHLDEQKIEALRSCWSVVSSFSQQSIFGQSSPSSSTGPLLLDLDDDVESKAASSEALLLAAEFQIGQMSVAVQSHGRSLAELQVNSIKSTINKRPTDTALCFTVQSLLIVDAMQTFGPDFELLVASHRNISLDSISGSIRDSEPVSPSSPASPNSTLNSGGGGINISAAIKQLEKSQFRRSGAASPLLWPVTTTQTNDDALIVVEYTTVQTANETTQLLSVQFNTLDIIANQETIAELAAFFKSYFPIVPLVKQPVWNSVASHIKLYFEFSRLSCLLIQLHPHVQDQEVGPSTFPMATARKVATVTVSDASIQVSSDENLEVRGSLGGVHIVDLTHNRSKHAKVVSVGRDPFERRTQSLVEQLQADLYSTSNATVDPEAFYFQLTEFLAGARKRFGLNIRMASVKYTHAILFWSDFASCLSSFRNYVVQVGNSLKSAATEVAIELVGGRTDVSMPSTPIKSTSTKSSAANVQLYLVIDSPIIMFPESPHSDRLLEAHLGRISVQNFQVDELEVYDKVLVDVRDMNLFSKNFEFGDKRNWPIVHNTALELNIAIYRERLPVQIEVAGNIISPLKVSLSKSQYCQIIRTVSLLSNELRASSSRVKDTTTIQLSNTSSNSTGNWSLKLTFHLPTLSIDLTSCEETSDRLVNITFSRFGVEYVQWPFEASTVNISLDSVTMENLLKSNESKHRFLVISSSVKRHCHLKGHKYVSSSCPDLTSSSHFLLAKSNSLPDKLDTENVFRNLRRLKEKMMYGGNIHHRQLSLLSVDECPFTPPPSPLRSSSPDGAEALVNVNIKLKPNERLTDINFNCLDIVVQYEPWRIVNEFFDSDENGESDGHFVANISNVSDAEEQQEVSNCPSKTTVYVRRLSVLLSNDDECDLASVSIGHLTMEMFRKSNGDLELDGNLTRVSLVDLTSDGGNYRERLTTSADETALAVKMLRFKSKDPKLLREFDVDIRLKMSAVLYVHTNRFYSHVTTFLHRLMEAEHKHNNKLETLEYRRSLRYRLNVSIDSPAIILPVALWSEDVLIARLGRITADNKFVNYQLVDGNCLLDVITIKLSDVELRMGNRNATNELLQKFQSTGEPLVTQSFHLDLKLKRNLEREKVKSIPDINVEGMVSAVRGTLNDQQYMVIRGILEHNIGELVLPVIPIATNAVKKPAKQVSIGSTSSEISTPLMLRLKLVDVQLDCNTQEAHLAQINFISSELTYRSTSSGSSEVDLVSREILVSDTRFCSYPANNRPNVFCNILQATRHRRKTKSQSKADVDGADVAEEEGFLQAELHYRANKDYRRLTVLLNHMRVIAIFDWWTQVLTFISATLPTPGVVTRQDLFLTSNQLIQPSPFEMKITFTETGIVVIEDASVWDTNAIILETTAIVNHCPNSRDKLLSCIVHRLEVFSCILGLEDDTALSIVDPVINADVVMRRRRKSGEVCCGGLKQLTNRPHDDRIVEVSVSELSVRLSYNDLRLFFRLLDRLPQQLKSKTQTQVAPQQPVYVASAEEILLASKMARLEAMGFGHGDCYRALIGSKMDVQEAALWLTQNATVTDKLNTNEPTTNAISNDFLTQLIEVKIHLGTLSLCLIDDCKDVDVPLLDFRLIDFIIERQPLNGDEYDRQTMGRSCVEGVARGKLDCDYYNRSRSGWEPFIEPFSFKANWRRDTSRSAVSTMVNQISIDVDGLVDVNVTSSLLELYTNVKSSWTEDYYNQLDRSLCSESLTSYRRRSPFVPFALKNSTGCRLHFDTMTINSEQLMQTDYDNAGSCSSRAGAWTSVEVDQVVPFSFDGRLRMRHRATRESRIHQLIIRVDGWQQVAPVSVDKVGVYFRDAKPAVVGHLTDKARLVFEVTLEGSARKLITVRSALVLYNQTETTVEVRLDGSRALLPIQSLVFHMKPNDILPVPLPHIQSPIYCRPYDNCSSVSSSVALASSYLYCCTPVRWQHNNKPNEVKEDIYVCNHMVQLRQPQYFRFCARIYRLNYPIDSPGTYPVNMIPPAHSIVLLPPVTLRNLLPFEMTFIIGELSGKIAAGKRKSVHHLDIARPFKLSFHFETSSFETFKLTNELEVSPGSSSFQLTLETRDSRNRSLLLNVRGSTYNGLSALQISIGAEYWIINRTGLPLIFKQEGMSGECNAGQSSDNEKARSLAPLLFSFSDYESPSFCIARIGRGLHPTGEPRWCRRFSLQKGIEFRRLYVASRSAKPDWVYSVGIDVRSGPSPKYAGLYVVTLTPRFQLDNHSSHRLEFNQKFALESGGRSLSEFILMAMPNSSLPFHWPRLDHEQLLCSRISDVSGCTWSGGFSIDKIDSFHICMRNGQAKPVFLRVEVVLLGATYIVVFTDADNLPPPYLIQNFCEVPIVCHQAQTTEERLKITVRPNTTLAYALDEPTLEASLTCVAPGGSSASYYLNVFGDCPQQLSYENFIYIAFTETFAKTNELILSRFGLTDKRQEELVLTVPTGSSKVILQRKEKGERSQLWRMTGEGMLQHEGSSPPRNSRKHGTSTAYQSLVLDIAEMALQPDRYTSLMLRKPNPQRASTQTWEFSEDGRLRCRHHNVFVQCADGYQGLRCGVAVVIGPMQPVIFEMTAKGIPVEQAISRHRLYPGSGLLCVRVVPDGPTRVLQILDIAKKSANQQIVKKSLEEVGQVVTSNWQVKLWLPVGVGISIVNRTAEELIYARLSNIMVEMVRARSELSLNGSIQDFQVDNQLHDAECPVVLYIINSFISEDQRNFHPAISFAGNWLSNSKQHLNVDIFKSLQLQVKNLNLTIEELLLCKLLQFVNYSAGFDSSSEDNFVEDGFKAASVALAKRYYFGNLKLVLEQVKLSVLTSPKLPVDLKSIKAATGLTLIRFEDALVELDPFVRSHSCETATFLLDSIWQHYKEELKNQAVKIFGSFDFLGNPIGLVNDVSEGLSELIKEGNVGGLLKNVTHGISNSAAKMTGTLSDGLSLVAMDEQHLESRRRIQQTGHTSGDHMVAGFKGLGFGLYSGITSIVTQTYEGASSEGLPGFLTGLGKGLVGTFTKPAAGVLDLATSAANAVRDTSKSKHRKAPERIRSRRLCVGPGGLLPRYSADHSRGLEILYQLNKKDYHESLVAVEGLNYSSDSLIALISSTNIYFVNLNADSKTPQKECSFEIPLMDLYHCKSVQELHQNRQVNYLELTIKGNESSGQEVVCRPRILCETQAIALRVSQQINYAKGLYEELIHTLNDNQ